MDDSLEVGLHHALDAELGGDLVEFVELDSLGAPRFGALRHRGYRPSKRYIVFQVLPDTLGLGPDVWRVLSKCHDMRNRTEYEGAIDVDQRLVADLINSCRKVAEKVEGLPSIAERSK